MTATDSSVETHRAAERVSMQQEVALLGREKHEKSGMYVSYMDVADISDRTPPEERELVLGQIAQFDLALQRHPEWTAPIVKDHVLQTDSLNPVSAMLYGPNFPCLQSWRESVPDARALSNLYWPHKKRLAGAPVDGQDLFNGELIDDATASFFLNGLDSVAIRTRAQLMKMIARRTIPSDSVDKAHWISLACGAAIPVLEALNGRQNVQLDLVDIDPDALEFAKRLALEASLLEGRDFTIHKDNLVTGLIRSDVLVDELGREQADMVDMMGIFEYFRPDPATRMLKNAFELVKPGGVLVLANMLSTRPQLDFNLRGVGWPHIQPRSLEEISTIIVNAGISLDDVEVYIPKDGVYAVVEIRKREKIE